jgi:hypothetical protein
MYVNCPTHPTANYKNLRGYLTNIFNDTTCTKIGDDLKVEYLRKYEADFKKAFVRESGAQGEFLDQNRSSKIS